MDIIGGYIGLGILLAFTAFLALFGGVEKEDKPTTHHTIKKLSKN